MAAPGIVLFWLLEEEEEKDRKAKLKDLNIMHLLKNSKDITMVQVIPYANKYYCGFYINEDSKPIVICLRKLEFQNYIVILKIPNDKLHFQEFKEPECQCTIF